MGFMDKFKGKAKEAADQHGDKIHQGIERAGDFVDEKTGGKYSEHVDRGQSAAREQLGGEDQEPGQQDTPGQGGYGEPIEREVPGQQGQGGYSDQPEEDLLDQQRRGDRPERGQDR